MKNYDKKLRLIQILCDKFSEMDEHRYDQDEFETVINLFHEVSGKCNDEKIYKLLNEIDNIMFKYFRSKLKTAMEDDEDEY